MKATTQKRTDFEEPVEAKPAELSALFADFVIHENGPTEWLVRCRSCKATWALRRPGAGESVKVGNVLKLLDHAGSHG